MNLSYTAKDFEMDAEAHWPLFAFDAKSNIEGAYRMAGHIKAGGDEETRVRSFRASTPTIDRHGTIVRTEGIKTDRFADNPIFSWNHNAYDMAQPEDVLGQVIGWQQDEARFDVDVRFDEDAKAEMAFQKVKSRSLRMVSIGFRALDAGYEAIDGQDEPIWVYRSSELLEIALVVLPSNPDAKEILHSFGPSHAAPVPPVSTAADFGTMAQRATLELGAIRILRERTR